MARKNGNGEGSRPRQRADGRWEARYWLGGKRRSVYGSSRKEAADKLAKALANNEEPRATFAATNITVQEYFAQYDDAVKDTMKRRSLETYRDIARLHLIPAFGNKKLKDLTREHVQRMYSQKRDAGLSAARVRRIHGVLSSALNHAVRWRLLDHNVCREVSPPRVARKSVAPERFAPERFALERSELLKSTPGRFAPGRSAPERSAPKRGPPFCSFHAFQASTPWARTSRCSWSAI